MVASACPLERACVALWSATLSLMAAYMQQPAPAHRLLLARRIAANFDILAAVSYTHLTLPTNREV